MIFGLLFYSSLMAIIESTKLNAFEMNFNKMESYKFPRWRQTSTSYRTWNQRNFSDFTIFLRCNFKGDLSHFLLLFSQTLYISAIFMCILRHSQALFTLGNSEYSKKYDFIPTNFKWREYKLQTSQGYVWKQICVCLSLTVQHPMKLRNDFSWI